MIFELETLVVRCGFLVIFVVFGVYWWVSGCFCGFLAVSVVFRLFWSFSGCLGDFLPLWGNCLAISVISWSIRPLSGYLGDFWAILAPFLVSSASFWPFMSILVGFWSLHSPKRHKLDGFTLTIHLLWDPGHTQASRRIFIFIGFVAACLLLLLVACYNLEANLESHHYK